MEKGREQVVDETAQVSGVLCVSLCLRARAGNGPSALWMRPLPGGWRSVTQMTLLLALCVFEKVTSL